MSILRKNFPVDVIKELIKTVRAAFYVCKIPELDTGFHERKPHFIAYVLKTELK